MGFKQFRHVGDGHINLDVDQIVGIGDAAPGRAKIWMRDRSEPFEVEGDAETVRRQIEAARRDADQPIYQKPLG